MMIVATGFLNFGESPLVLMSDVTKFIHKCKK